MSIVLPTPNIEEKNNNIQHQNRRCRKALIKMLSAGKTGFKSFRLKYNDSIIFGSE